MNLDHLRYFACLAQVKHYTRAAQQLCISQPSLSHAIRQLEGELGVPLFEKTGRNTTLTPFGETFLTTVHQTLGTLEEGVETLRRSARGEGLIRLGFLRRLGSRYIPQLAAEFLAAHPARNLSFTFHTDRTQGLGESLLHRQCDLVFCSQPDPALPLTAVPVVRQELVLITPKDHPLAGRGAVADPSLIRQFQGGAAADKEEQARRVFDALREFDHEAVTEIYAQCPDTAGLGLAVANRLKKAAGFHVIEV